jgi:hypothetical protein
MREGVGNEINPEFIETLPDDICPNHLRRGELELEGKIDLPFIKDNSMSSSSVIDPIYLPFTPDELREHFLVNKDKQVEIYQKSAQTYREFLDRNSTRKGIPITKAKGPCQIERDE